MHMPSEKLWQEMLACPQLIRFNFPIDQDGHKATLIIKSNTLMLKYIIQMSQISLVVFPLNGRKVGYALHVMDDPGEGAILWSIVSTTEEIQALNAIKMNSEFPLYLFNEACVNVASNWVRAQYFEKNIDFDSVELCKEGLNELSKYSAEINSAIKSHKEDFIRGSKKLEVLQIWKSLRSSHILSAGNKADLELIGDNEGVHQEQLAFSLIGDLSPSGAFINPVMKEPSGNKEFTDLLLTHKYGTVLIESKTLSIFDRHLLPDRNKLVRNIEKSASRARVQIQNAVRKLIQKKIDIYDSAGNIIEAERNNPPQAIILVPDLSLLSDRNDQWLKHMLDFVEENQAFLHLLDTIQLFRASQAGHMLSHSSNSTPMMGFEYYLMERAKFIFKTRDINSEYLIRIK